MATLQHEALKAIAGEQEEMFAFCELHGVYYHKMEPPYLTMGRIAQWALLMKNDVVTKIPGTKIPCVGWESGRQETPMSEGGQV
jgi:hypothetical protein